MYEQILGNTQHAYFGIATAMQAVDQAVVDCDRLKAEALYRDRGVIEKISWNLESGIDDEGGAYSYANEFTLTLGGGRTDLYLGDRLDLGSMEDFDIENLEWGGELLGEVAQNRADVEGIEFASALDQVLGGVLDIPAELVRDFLWLASTVVGYVYDIETHLSLIPAQSG